MCCDLMIRAIDATRIWERPSCHIGLRSGHAIVHAKYALCKLCDESIEKIAKVPLFLADNFTIWFDRLEDTKVSDFESDVMAKRSIPTTAANQPQQKSILKSSSILAGNKRARFDTTNATTAGKKARPTPAKKVKRSSVLLPVNHSNSNSTKSVKSISIKTTPPPAAPTTFIVSVGSYERLLYGLSCTFSIDANSTTGFTLSLNPIFSFPAHLSSIKSVATSLLASPQTGSERKVGGKYLVSGGTDEVIKVWDLKRKKEVGSLEGEAAGSLNLFLS